MNKYVVSAWSCAVLLACDGGLPEDVWMEGSHHDDSFLRTIAEGIVSNELTEAEFLDLGLSETETRDLIVEVGVLRGVNRVDMMSWVYDGDQNQSVFRGACSQNLEKANLSGDTFASSFYNDTWCDGDGNDIDLVYVFFPSWSDDPDDMRWWSTNWWVRQVFSAPQPSYNGLLLGHSLCTSPVLLCLGTNGVAAAGGEWTVYNSLFVSH